MKRVSMWLCLAALTTAAFAGSALTATAALAGGAPGGVMLTSSLAPSVPSDPMLHGVSAGFAPWVLKLGAFQLLGNGKVEVVIRGLVIPELGTPGPVKTVEAAIYCGNETAPAATTDSAPLSEQGDAVITSRVDLPDTCLTPAVLINPNGIGSIYIATSGFSESPASPFSPDLLSSSLAPSVPSDPMLHGVTAGSAPWVLKHSAFLLVGNVAAVDIRGLVIPELGTPGPVKTVEAAIYCGNETKAAAVTASAPLSEKGDAVIVSPVTLPETCLTPAVLIDPNGIGSIYIATSGFSR
jgi:hypothetical protein